jgi:hypothetical protein
MQLNNLWRSANPPTTPDGHLLLPLDLLPLHIAAPATGIQARQCPKKQGPTCQVGADAAQQH